MPEKVSIPPAEDSGDMQVDMGAPVDGVLPVGDSRVNMSGSARNDYVKARGPIKTGAVPDVDLANPIMKEADHVHGDKPPMTVQNK